MATLLRKMESKCETRTEKRNFFEKVFYDSEYGHARFRIYDWGVGSRHPLA